MNSIPSRTLARWLVLICLLLVAGSAAAAERGLLWKIESPGVAPSYLFGTIHTDDNRVTDFSPELKTALQQSGSFMMEILPQQDFSAIFLKEGSLRDWLDAKQLKQMQILSDANAIPEEMALRMKPWLLAAIFSLPHPQSPFTQDIQLFGMAQSEGKTVLGLETSAEHFGALDDMPIADQVTLLTVTLADSPQKKEAAYDKLMEAYLSRDVERIAALDEESLEADVPKAVWQAAKERLLDRRNVRMVQRIAQQVVKGPVFVAVGAAHLAGEGGLIARLRQAGFRVEAVQ